MARKGRIKSNPSPPPRHPWQPRGRISQPRSLALGFLLAQRSTPTHPVPPSCLPRVSVRKKILHSIYFRRGGGWEKEMLRKKTHVVRKKTHVVRNFFYVASIFYGAPPRQNRCYVISFVPTARRLVAGYNLHAAMQNCGRPPRHRDEPPRRHDGNAPRALPSAGGNAQGGIWKRRRLIP